MSAALQPHDGWIEQRLGLRAWKGGWLDRKVPGGGAWGHVLGVVLLFLFVQQVVLGVLLATTFSPSIASAWASTAYIQDRVTLGWFIRGLHHHGSSAIMVVTALHLARGAWAGAYRAPREFNWWSGLVLGGLVFALAHTGYQLPWDHRGYTATAVATGLVGSLPGGGAVRDLLLGGSDFGNLTITRFYALHVFVLPIGVGLLLALHLWLHKRHGHTPAPSVDEAAARPAAPPYWKAQLVRDVAAIALTVVFLLTLTVATHGAELGPPADPAHGGVARPAWYDLFLFQLLKYFEGPLRIIAIAVIPGAVLAYFAALPLLDRAPTRAPRARVGVLGGVAAIMSGVVLLTVLALVEDARSTEYQEHRAEMLARGAKARELALQGVLPGGGDAVWENDPDHRVLELYAEHCSVCHVLNGKGGQEAPALDGFSGRAWLAGAIRDPRSPRYFGGTKGHDDMPAYAVADLPDADLAAVVEYLMRLRDDPEVTVDAALADRGQALWDSGDLDCNGCHEIEVGKGSGGPPTFAGRGTKAWIAEVIRDSSKPPLYDAEAEMPRFSDKLDPKDIELLAEYIARQGEGQ